MLRQRGVETVILAGADAHGIMRGKRVPIAELDRAAERGIALSDVVWALPVDEHEPVRETARSVPWHDRTALLLCDFVSRDGAAIPLSPRAVLRSVVERVVEHCVAMRRAELAAQAAAVTDWETARYLEAL